MLQIKKMLIIRNKKYAGGGIFDILGKKLVPTALSVGRTAANEIGKQAVDVGKSVAFDAGKQLTTKLLTSKNRPVELTKKSKDTLSKIINQSAENAVEIQDLVRRLNGGV